jgi:hypothetical protein
MRRKGLCTLGLMASLGSSLQSGWKITTVSKVEGRQSIETEYCRGDLRRTDRSDQDGSHKHVQILDRGNRRLTVWDFDSRQYAIHRFNQQRLPAKPLPPAATVTIERATTDTGERRVFFGRTARHLITRERVSQSDDETVIDGWYIDSEGLPSQTSEAVLVSYVVGQAHGPPVFKVNQTGPKPTGLAVSLKKNSTHDETTWEVTELIEGPLPDDLFEPPPGFERVLRFPSGYSMPWTEHLRLTWEWLQDWVASLFP